MKTISTQARQRRAIEAKKSHANLFRYATSAADEIYFRKWIQNWLLTPPSDRKPTWGQLLHNMVTIRNKDPRELKYCYFNNRLGQVFVSTDFTKWATHVREAMKKLIKKYYA